jgi:hypothetical protein
MAKRTGEDVHIWLPHSYISTLEITVVLDPSMQSFCKYFGLPTDSVRTSGEVLEEFLRGPQRPKWIRG